jgi:hypothetical protein
MVVAGSNLFKQHYLPPSVKLREAAKYMQALSIIKIQYRHEYIQ